MTNALHSGAGRSDRRCLLAVRKSFGKRSFVSSRDHNVLILARRF